MQKKTDSFPTSVFLLLQRLSFTFLENCCCRLTFFLSGNYCSCMDGWGLETLYIQRRQILIKTQFYFQQKTKTFFCLIRSYKSLDKLTIKTYLLYGIFDCSFSHFTIPLRREGGFLTIFDYPVFNVTHTRIHKYSDSQEIVYPIRLFSISIDSLLFFLTLPSLISICLFYASVLKKTNQNLKK